MIDKERQAGPDEVLTVAEENALSVVREVVDNLRARGLTLDFERVEPAMIAAGARLADGETQGEVRLFRLQGALFSLRVGVPPTGAVEINFLSDSP